MCIHPDRIHDRKPDQKHPRNGRTLSILHVGDRVPGITNGQVQDEGEESGGEESIGRLVHKGGGNSTKDTNGNPNDGKGFGRWPVWKERVRDSVWNRAREGQAGVRRKRKLLCCDLAGRMLSLSTHRDERCISDNNSSMIKDWALTSRKGVCEACVSCPPWPPWGGSYRGWRRLAICTHER